MGAAGVLADFELPTALEATAPPEARGLRRDEVRLLVSNAKDDSIVHARFHDLPRWLAAGDVLVVNTSGTLPAALTVTRHDGTPLELHLSTRLPGSFWSVEVRQPGGGASVPFREALAGDSLRLPGGGRATILAPYPLTAGIAASSRLWLAALDLPQPLDAYLERHGFPIRYGYVTRRWPVEMYQTIFANEPGSAEMPSAARPFTPDLVTRLIANGVIIAPVLLHTGVASLEDHEPPYEEYYRVPRATADVVNAARRAARRIVAVGTTVVRALETTADETGVAHPGEGWTSLVIGPERPLRIVDSLITGLHEPRATHLAMLERVAIGPSMAGGTRHMPRAAVPALVCGACHLKRAYDAALREGYLWHEFGDAHLILG
jgi:S-adenosylmethionine:tRNA ribosyltransferase-isomerase